MSKSSAVEADGIHMLTAIEIEVLINGPKVADSKVLKVAISELVQSGALHLTRVDTPRLLRQPKQMAMLTR